MSVAEIIAPAAEPAAPKLPPRVCKTCASWRPESLPGTVVAEQTWGSCGLGLPENTTLAGRMTTDLTVCTGHTYKKVTA